MNTTLAINLLLISNASLCVAIGAVYTAVRQLQEQVRKDRETGR